MLTPSTSEELRTVYSEIRSILVSYPREAEIIRRLATELKRNTESIDPLIEEMTSKVCPRCENSNCTNLNGRFDWCDLIYWAALDLDVSPFKDGLKDEDPCQFLGEKGCILPRTRRPHRCNWWYCEPLLEFMEKWPPGKQRIFISLAESITQKRKQLCDKFKDIQKTFKVAG